MTDDFNNLRLSPAADFTVETVDEVQTTADKLPSPTFVSDAVGPEVVVVEGRKRKCSITHETVGCMRVHAEKERNEQVVSVPEGLERLLSDPVMRCGIHEQHAKQHNMSGNATSLGVVNLEGNLGTNLGHLNVEETTHVSLAFAVGREVKHILDVMGRNVQNREEQHSVSDLSVEPHGFVQGQYPDLRPDHSQDVSAHGHHDDHGINGENKTSTSRYPDGEL